MTNTKLQAKLKKLNAQLKITKGRQNQRKLIEKILKVEAAIEQIQKNAIVAFKRLPKTRTLTLETPRRAWRAWVAEISPEKDIKHGGFTKKFIEPVSRKFEGKKGEASATFEIPIDLNAIYQDSDGDYWVFQNIKGEIQCISYQEVCYRFSLNNLVPKITPRQAHIYRVWADFYEMVLISSILNNRCQ